MKVKDIAEKYNIEEYDFISFLVLNKLPYTVGFSGNYVDDNIVDKYVKKFLEFKETKNREEERKARLLMSHKERVELERKNNAVNIPVIAGHGFEGYVIRKYAEMVFADEILCIDRDGPVSSKFHDRLATQLPIARNKLIEKLKCAAYDCGCNAIVEISFSQFAIAQESFNITGGTLYQPYVICISASGNAVVIEKIEN